MKYEQLIMLYNTKSKVNANTVTYLSVIYLIVTNNNTTQQYPSKNKCNDKNNAV